MKLLAVATSPAQIFNIAQYIVQQQKKIDDCLLVHVKSALETDNSLARNMIQRFSWGEVHTVPRYIAFQKSSEEFSAAKQQSWLCPEGKKNEHVGIFSKLGTFYSRINKYSSKVMSRPLRSLRDLNRGDQLKRKLQSTAELDLEWRAGELLVRSHYASIIDETLSSSRFCPETVILGDYRPISFRQVISRFDTRNSEFVLVDDGSVTRQVARFRSGQAKPDEIVRHIPLALGDDDPFVIGEPESLTLFSIYSDMELSDNDRIIHNEFFDRHAERDSLQLRDEIWIAGANHVEAGLAHADGYMQALSMIRSWFPDTNIIYIPHRRESKEKVESIKSQLGVDIRHTEFGIEQYAIDAGIRPKALMAFGSTVIDTLSRLFASTTTHVCVAVPARGYFTKSRRAAHVESIISDNIRQNEGVVGVRTDRFNRDWFRAKLKKVETCALSPSSPLSLPSFPVGNVCNMENFGSSEVYRFRELSVKGLHSVSLGKFKLNGPLSGFLGLISEGRSVFRVRVKRLDDEVAAIDLRFDCDKVGNYDAFGGIGSVSLSCSVTEDRRARVSMAFCPDKPGIYEILLITQRSNRSNSSLYEGNPEVGFAIERILPHVNRRFIDMSEGEVTLFIHVKRSGVTPIFVIGMQNTVALFIHNKKLTSQEVEECRMASESPGFSSLMIKVGNWIGQGELATLTPINFRISEKGLEVNGNLICEECSLQNDGLFIVDQLVPDGPKSTGSFMIVGGGELLPSHLVV